MTTATFLVALLAIFAAAKLFGELAERIGQPAVLGEIVGGVVVGVSGLRLVDPAAPVLHVLADLGIILLLFLIGLRTDLDRLLSVGGASITVALTGVTLSFAGGVGVGMLLGHPFTAVLFLGAAISATSIGITVRVLSDLGRTETQEGQVIVGAAVIDDIIGLLLLAALSATIAGHNLTALGTARLIAVALGFVIAAIVLGSVLAPRLIELIVRLKVGKALFFGSLLWVLAMAWLADLAGSSLIVGAFAAGLVLARTKRCVEIEREIHNLAVFFVPIFFVSIGAAIDVRRLNFPTGVLLTLVAIAAKLIAGQTPFWRPLRRSVVGTGMIPRGEVTLLFAQVGLSAGVLSTGLYGSIAFVVVVTTLVVPPALRALVGPSVAAPEEESLREELLNEPMTDFTERRQT
ncbi:MAG TPA: cation:proton antiporter [Thermoanaerobaculia bacterium]|nr:cation:proton antiporter [Thermoanaerobaculia bacterium]